MQGGSTYIFPTRGMGHVEGGKGLIGTFMSPCLHDLPVQPSGISALSATACCQGLLTPVAAP